MEIFQVAELVMDIRLDFEQVPSHLSGVQVCQLLGKKVQGVTLGQNGKATHGTSSF